MTCAVEPVTAYAVGGDSRAQQKKLRARLYTAEQRGRRDRTLAEIARRAGELR